MDSFMNLAKQGYQKYQESQQTGQRQSQQGHSQTQSGLGQQQQQQGGPEYNNTPGQAPHVNTDAAIASAQAHGGSKEDDGLFAQGLKLAKMFGQDNAKAPQNVEVDEQGLQNAHKEAYQQGNAGGMDASSMGAAAALQAFKKFMGNNTAAAKKEEGSGDMMSKLIGMAMAEASKMFDKNGATSGNKGDATSSAATTIMKLYIKSQASGSTGTGGMGGLMQMAGKFM